MDDDSYNSGHGHAYEKFGVDPEKGATVIVRPDQCMFLQRSHSSAFDEPADLCFPDVSKVISIDATEQLGDFFDGFCVSRAQNGHL